VDDAATNATSTGAIDMMITRNIRRRMGTTTVAMRISPQIVILLLCEIIIHK
jgi:hypothetical protein